MILFRYLWSIWCIIWFVLCSTFAVLGYRIILAGKESDKKLSIALRWSKHWAYWLMGGFGIFVITKNKQKIKGIKNAIYVSNHLSFLDIPTCAITNPNSFRFLSKAEIQKMPFVGYVLKRIYYTVDRTSAESRKESMRIMGEGIKRGFPVHLYIEGTRNKTPEAGFLPFQKGAAILAIEHQLPIIPIYIKNTHKKLSAKGFKGIAPGIIRTSIGQPIQITKQLSVEEINLLILDSMSELKQSLK